MSSAPQEVIVHPLVLLSVADHYSRVASNTKKRVVGCLLGSTFQGKVDITNSFAVPFEEDARNPEIWYLDQNFLEAMSIMFKKINAKERIVGFYSTGPKIREADIQMEEMFRAHCPHPLLVIIDVRPDVEGLPTQAYYAVEEVEGQGEVMKRNFRHITSSIGAYEAEEVGVEHLLRDINDPSVSTLANRVKDKLTALGGLEERLREMAEYLALVATGRLPINNAVVYNVQNIFNLLPNLHAPSLIRAMNVQSNDMYMTMYISSLIRCIVALHDLVNNKLKYKDQDELDEDKKKREEAESKKGKESKKKSCLVA